MSKFIAYCATLFACLAIVPHSAAQELPADAPRKVQQVTLSPPKEASIRQKSGPARSFTLISLTEEIVTVRNSAGKELEIEMDKIQTIRTRDGEFDYSPSDEIFSSLVRRASRISGVSVETVEVYDPIERIAPGEESRSRLPARTEQGPDFVPAENPDPADPDFVAATEPDPEVATIPTTSEDPDPEATPANSSHVAAPGTTIFTCASCGRDLPASLRDGEKCPHCGIVFWSAGPPVVTAADNNNTTAANGYPDANGYPSTTTPASTTTTQTPTTIGSSFGDAPIWMKAGFFIGLLAICWLLFQRR